MLKNRIIKAALFVVMAVSAVPAANAGWFDDAVESAKERVGTRAVDEAADGAYDAAKDAAFEKKKGGAKDSRQQQDGPSLREPEQHRPAAGLGGDAIDDDHFIQKDDYFVSTTALDKNPYIYVSLSKMVTQPSARSKGEAEFFKVIDGSRMWTRYFYRSRIAGDSEIRLGTVVLVFEGRIDENVYLPPETKESARGGTWFMAKVTDVSDLYRGHVTVSGNYKVSVGNLRVLLPESPRPSK